MRISKYTANTTTSRSLATVHLSKDPLLWMVSLSRCEVGHNGILLYLQSHIQNRKFSRDIFCLVVGKKITTTCLTDLKQSTVFVSRNLKRKRSPEHVSEVSNCCYHHQGSVAGLFDVDYGS